MSKIVQLKDNDGNVFPKSCEIYSTTEKRIGKWVDGKPIYRKSFSGTTVNNSNVVLGYISDIDNVINAYGWATSNYSNTWGIPSGRTDNYNNNWRLSTNNNQLALVFGSYYTNNGKFTFTIEYTKTTD